jgi:hypothetical protein
MVDLTQRLFTLPVLPDLIASGVVAGAVWCFFGPSALTVVEKTTWKGVSSIADTVLGVFGVKDENGRPVNVAKIFPTWKSWADNVPETFNLLGKGKLFEKIPIGETRQSIAIYNDKKSEMADFEAFAKQRFGNDVDVSRYDVREAYRTRFPQVAK